MNREARRAELVNMLTYMRPEGSPHERKFIARYITPLKVKQDTYGNLIKTIKNPDGSEPQILWSCHTDTVHRTSSRQEVFVLNDYAYTTSKECLGADCTTGAWIMRHMILAKIPGLYIFHRGEETGRKGSTWLARNNPQILDHIRFAIAFDRKGTDSIITKQMSSTCCSPEFAKSLDAALGGGFKEDPSGSYTDTASYTKLVSECTNLSVGYYNAHCGNEIQDLAFSDYLLEQILEADFTQLVAQRDPTYVEPRPIQKYTSYGSHNHHYDDWGGSYFKKPKSKSKTLTNCEQLAELIQDNPNAVADYLDQFGITPDDLREYIWGYGSLVA